MILIIINESECVLMVTTKQQTRKQHYYPRCLLKHFANSDNKINTYIRYADIFQQLSYKNVCYKRDTYETGETDMINNILENKIDNILENKLSEYEAKMSIILNEILLSLNEIDSSENYNISIPKESQDFIYRFMILQYTRTDYGRLSFMNYYLHSIIHTSNPYKPRTCPYELHDVENNQIKIKLFNQIFKQPYQLESFFDSIKRPNFMKFHIAFTHKNLITSDNPVIITSDIYRLMMPVSPNVCLQFIDQRSSVKINMIGPLNDSKVDYLNKATINTSMYFVISNNPFTNEEKNYIRKRFEDPKSILKPPFVRPKIYLNND